MKILGLDSTAGPASVSLLEDGKILGEFFIHTKLTHSVTLMPMCRALLENTKTTMQEVDAFAVAAGPGSFTGVRIGVAAVKGMAQALDKPCISVSALEAMAQNLKGTNAVICAVMDARCSQFYNALFESRDGTVTRLTEDRALASDELADELTHKKGRIILVGDGSDTAMRLMAQKVPNLETAQEQIKYQRASGVCLAAAEKYQNGQTLKAAELMPVYLRLPQAQRELMQKQKTEG